MRQHKVFKEVLYLVPKIASGALSGMENALNSRFARVAKKFAKGMAAAVGLTGAAGIGLALVNKILNPLKEVQESIEKTLHMGDDLADQARQFNTTAGELAKLQAFGKTEGLDAGDVNELLTKFQGAVAEAVADPNKETSVRKFTGEKNTAQAFLTFMENLQALDKVDHAAAVQAQIDVFGERKTGKSSNFLGADFSAKDKQFAKFNTAKLTKDIGTLDQLQQKVNDNQAQLFLSDIGSKAGALGKKDKSGKDIVEVLNERDKIAQDRENERLAAAQDIVSVQNNMDQFFASLEKEGLPLLKDIISGVKTMSDSLRDIANSRFIKGILGKGKK